jgi:hypothetical protein
MIGESGVLLYPKDALVADDDMGVVLAIASQASLSLAR